MLLYSIDFIFAQCQCCKYFAYLLTRCSLSSGQYSQLLATHKRNRYKKVASGCTPPTPQSTIELVDRSWLLIGPSEEIPVSDWLITETLTGMPGAQPPIQLQSLLNFNVDDLPWLAKMWPSLVLLRIINILLHPTTGI